MHKTRRGFFGALAAVVGAIFVPKSGAMPVKFVIEDSCIARRSLTISPDVQMNWHAVEIDDDREFDFNPANSNPTLYIHL